MIEWESSIRKIRRKFDVQFKIQVCKAIELGVQTILEVCKDNQLQRPVVEGWMQRYVARSLTGRLGNREKELERENEKLRAKIGEMAMTIDLLKKVEAWKKQQTSAASSIITSKNLAQFSTPTKPLDSPPRAITTNRNKTR